MSRHLSRFSSPSFWGMVVMALSLALITGCSRGPSAKELSLLEEKKQATEAAESTLEKKKAQKASLERKLAEKKVEKKALDEKLSGTRASLSNWE
jgi:septal ring factor EnvC (AmiA/AmiB activator)